MNVLTLAEEFSRDLGLSPAALATKAEAFAFLKSNGLPQRHLEDWHYTSTKALAATDFVAYTEIEKTLTSGWAAHAATAKWPNAINLFFVNDVFLSSQSDKHAGLTVKTVDAENKGPSPTSTYDGLQALSDIFQRFTTTLEINLVLPKPIVIHVFSENSNEKPSLCSVVWHLKLGPSAKADVLIQHNGVSGEHHFQMSQLTVDAAEHAELKLLDTRDSKKSHSWFSQTHLKLQTDAIVQAWQFFGGGGWFRNNVSAELLGERANVHLQGLSYCRDQAHCDHFINIVHSAGDTRSTQKYKGILDDGAKTIFTGKIRIQHQAQKSAAEQLAKFLQLDDKSEFNARPILEIYADDVKASHGASTGFLDPEELFYLRSRGLSGPTAEKLLKEAFLADLLEAAPVGVLQSHIRSRLHSYFAASEGGPR